jgi:vacuolar iron transporter family protein
MVMNSNATTNGSPRKTRDQKTILKILESNWQAEARGYHTYETLSERESDPQRRSALRGLSYAEKHHADLWAARILALGGPTPAYNGSKTGEADTLANRVGGKGLALRRLELV